MKRKILIVEDDPVHRSHLARLITRLGHESVLLSSGQEALEMIMKERDPTIAALILDLVMPDLDGMGVITRLRAAGYRTPIIVLVKPSALDSALAAIAAGAQDFCLIPAGFERVAVSLKNILAPSVLPLRRAPLIDPRIARGSFPHAPSAYGPKSNPSDIFENKDAASASVSIIDHQGQLRSLSAIERDVIALAMKTNSQPFAVLARALGISRSTLYRRIEEISQSEIELNPPIYGDAA